MVAGWTLNRRAASAAVFLPFETILIISTCCCGLSFGRRPPIRPCLRALSRPALVLSRSIARSNSANAPSICIVIRPAGLVVSIASLKLRNPAFALAMCSIMVRTSRRERESRSSFHTTRTSAFRSWSRSRCSSGRSQRPPEAFSRKIRSHPADLRAPTCAAVSCSFVETYHPLIHLPRPGPASIESNRLRQDPQIRFHRLGRSRRRSQLHREWLAC